MIVPMVVDAFRADAGPVSRTNQFTISSFVATYDARRSGDGLALDVTERITANFPNRYTNRGIERRLDARFGSTDIGLSNFRVTDPSGTSMPFTRRTEDDGDITLRIGSAGTYVYGRVDYVISYTITRAMVQARDRQEIYLDVNGTGWQQRFDRVQATVNVPPTWPAACWANRPATAARPVRPRAAASHAPVTRSAPSRCRWLRASR